MKKNPLNFQSQIINILSIHHQFVTTQAQINHVFYKKVTLNMFCTNPACNTKEFFNAN